MPVSSRSLIGMGMELVVRSDVKTVSRSLNEYVFRLNKGNVRNHTMIRLGQIIKNVVEKRLTYKDLTR